MPPQRPLPDLCLISVFKMLTPNEQLKASEMSPRCAVLVRAANRTVKMLVITSEDYGEEYNLDKSENRINSFSLAYRPSMQQLLDIPGETYSGYPMTTYCLSKWNILRLEQLRLLDTTTIEQIVTIFSAVTELKFLTSNNKHIDTLVALLQHPNWKCQLIDLMVDRACFTMRETFKIDSQLAGEMISAINGLTALQLLALDWDNHTEVPDLPILAQLKAVVFNPYPLRSFLRSLERNAADNADLEVHLICDDTKALLTLSQPLHSRIVRYGLGELSYTRDQVPLLCSQFRSLTSLELYTIKSTKVEQLFSDLSQLHQLIHLNFGVDFGRVKKDLPPLPARSLAQLNSLRALELHLFSISHSQIEWLNLPWTMPNLKTIEFFGFNCGSCKVWFSPYDDSPLISSPAAIGCFRSSLFNLHLGVPLNQIFLHSGKEIHSAEELLLQNP